MVEKYIIDKEDLPKLIRGEELSLEQGKARAFRVEIVGGFTNGDMLKIIFKPYLVTETAYGYHVFLTENDYKNGEWLNYSKAWWNAPYKTESEEYNMNQYEIDYKQGYDKANDEWLERIDKIKAEIDMLSDSECNRTTITIYSWGGMKRKVFEILDKYKAERSI